MEGLIAYILSKKHTDKAIAALGHVFEFKGTKPTYDDLPTTGNKVGDVWLVEESGIEYVWVNPGRWEALGGTGAEDSRYIGLIEGDGTRTTFTLNHQLGTRDFSVTVYNATTFEDVICDVVRTDLNNVQIGFLSAPAIDEDYVVICLMSKGPKGERGLPGKVQDVLNHEGTSVVDPNTGIANLPESAVYTEGYGIGIDDNEISVNTEVIADVDYVDANITDTMNYIIQEKNAEKAAREAGDNLLSGRIDGLNIKVEGRMALAPGEDAKFTWNGDTTGKVIMTIPGTTVPSTLCKVSSEIVDSDKYFMSVYITKVTTIDGETTTETRPGMEYFTHGGSEGEGWCVAEGDTGILIVSGEAGTHQIMWLDSLIDMTIPEDGTYLFYKQDGNTYMYFSKVDDGTSTDAFIEQSGEDITENTAEVLSEYLATQTQRQELQTEISNLKNIGRFCAIWNASTGLPTTEPVVTPYEYKVGDYFRIGVAGYRVPTGSTYVQGQYDTVTEETGIGDVWYFDSIQWVKQASSGGGTVMDVQAAGTSVLSGGIANIPLASSNPGVVKIYSALGVGISAAGNLSTVSSSSTDITDKTNSYKPIVPSNLDKAVMEGLNPSSSFTGWTDSKKAGARTTIGAGEPVEIIVF